MTRLLLENIKKEFKGVPVFENVNLHAEGGRLIAIKGKSGVGKSTLLNIIAGLERPTSGELFLNNVDMNECSFSELTKLRGSSVGYISQHSPMIPKLTALENICVPLWFKNEKEENFDMDRINQLGELLEIKHLFPKKIQLLSGGEVQRVGIIRSLINNPELIVADEPTGSLDDETTLKILSYFDKLKEQGLTIIIATHSSLVADRCDLVYELRNDGLLLI
ncbi:MULTISPECIES: ABC transporter ATP-binding protein [unclassified Psychrobacillus]|uniref:ABC transporter ATP-binding protein n=1 Tax=unclassified Psychrobacillus TaxID=2636677 RepID=UPI0030F5E919